MRRLFALGLCLVLLLGTAASAAPTSLWTRTEEDGGFVTVRIPYSQGEDTPSWSERQALVLRYADTKQVVPLTSEYRQGYLFATVPAEHAQRPLEVFQSAEYRFPDLIEHAKGETYYIPPGGTDDLHRRGILLGDPDGNINADALLTRAEAFTLFCRLLSLQPDGDPGYDDVSPSDWYFDTASAARAAGLAPADTYFHPSRPVVRGELTTLLAQAMGKVGWLRPVDGTAADLDYVDAGNIPSWALDSYLALAPNHLGVFTYRDTGALDIHGYPEAETLAQWNQPVTRAETISLLEQAMRFLPVYPHETAIRWGFDRQMPVIDGSTSTYPYTRALYGGLFQNAQNHPQHPASHSKSHESYQRLLGGQVDLLFAATKASQDLEAQARAEGVELEYVPIAYDAMVFFTNEENDVDGLTKQQIQEIYVNNLYDNWSQVGGPNAALLPYRRNTDSGSHALMEQFFLEDGQLSLSPDIYNVYTSYAMTSALTDVANALQQDPPAYAIGYSVYYYYLNSQWLLGDAGGGALKLLAVDGVAPTDGTIADGSYPLAGHNYAVIRADEPADSPARRLVSFMLSADGQNCVRNAGFGSLASDQ